MKEKDIMPTDTEFVQYGEYKGSPTITLKKSAEDKWPFSFGFKKAQLIVQHIEEIKHWVETMEKMGVK